MLLAMATGKGSAVCAADFGLNGITAADGLAVTRASALVWREMRGALDGCFTVHDEDLFEYLRLLDRTAGIRIEPSACAGFAGLQYLSGDPKAIHIVWATGGGMVPNEEMDRYLS